MKALIDHGADVNAKETLRGTTALMWAADESHPEALQFLLQHGADINARSNPAARGRGPALGKANDPRKQVAAQGAALAAGQALDLGALRQVDEGGGAAAQGQRGGAQGQRGAGGAGGAGAAAAGANAGDDNQDDGAGGFRRPAPIDGGELTVLTYAARSNDLESVKVLLAAGADVNQVSGYGWSALLVATQNRYYKLGAYLLDRGANPNLANKGGWVPLRSEEH